MGFLAFLRWFWGDKCDIVGSCLRLGAPNRTQISTQTLTCVSHIPYPASDGSRLAFGVFDGIFGACTREKSKEIWTFSNHPLDAKIGQSGSRTMGEQM